MIVNLFHVFIYQETIDEEMDETSRLLWTAAAPFVRSTTPADKFMSVSDERGQRQDERTALFSSLTTDVHCESEHVDDKGQDNVLCDLISGHMNDLDSRMTGDADDVCGLQVDDTEPQISHDPSADKSAGLLTPRVNKPYACDVCDKTYWYYASFKSHKQIHSDLMAHKCDMCQKAFSKNSYLSKDKRSMDQRLCDICTEACVTSTDLTRRRRKHTADKPHEYEVREKQATRDINEVDDRLSGGGEKVVSEHVVDDTEAENSWDEAADNTVTHNNPAADTSHATNTRPYVCDICAESFMTAGVFEIHRQMRHTSRRPYSCDVCLQNFTDYGSLRRHMFWNKFEMCQKRFSWPPSLQSQTRVCAAKNLHECEVCHRRFSKLGSLQVHKRIHYGCHSCSARFSGPDSLKTHMMLHAEFPTQCHSTSNHVSTGSDAPAVKQVSNCFLIVFTTSWSDIAVCIC